MNTFHAAEQGRTCMKRILIGLTAALALALVGTARADDTKTSESKTSVKKNDDGTMSVKSEKKVKRDPKGAGNASSDSSTYTKDVDKNSMGGTSTKIEKKAKHDAPGMANDRSSDTKETIERDAAGNVVKHEKTTEPVK
jgi:hypothetical protein